MNTYTECLRFLDQKTRLGIKFGLDNIRSLLVKLGSPEKNLRFIHIAGTNGKGSVSAMLSSVLARSKINVGLYTSPHLVDIKERIRINDKNIQEDEFLDAARKVAEADNTNTTYFEFLTAVALEYFNSRKVSIAIMEAGMGGRLDATNVCNADIAIVTDIGLEHTQYLGDTIEDITREKMAIIKPESHAIVSKDLAEGTDYGVDSWDLDSQGIWAGNYKNIRLNLLGRHQARNCALAIKTIEALKEKGYDIPEESVFEGLKNVNWPGRFQVVSKEPLIILDGAHNTSGAIALRRTIEEYLQDKGIILVFGVLRDKDYNGISDILFPVANYVLKVTPKSDRALQGDRELDEGMSAAIKMADTNTAIIVTGSLYLVGEALTIYENSCLQR